MPCTLRPHFAHALAAAERRELFTGTGKTIAQVFPRFFFFHGIGTEPDNVGLTLYNLAGDLTAWKVRVRAFQLAAGRLLAAS